MLWTMRWTLLFVLCLPQLACAQAPTTQPHRAVLYTHDVRPGPPPLHLHVVSVDLADPAVSLVVRPGGADPDGAGPWQTSLMTVRAVANRDDLAAAVNGDFFMPKDTRNIAGRKVPYFDGNWAKVVGHAMSDGKAWATPVNAAWVALVVGPGNEVTLARRAADVPKDAREIVGGSNVLVENGKAIAKGEPPAPRTAAGVDRAGKRLILLVVDGRRPEYSAGMTLDQLADEMVKLGCDRAINLDGGGSSTMVVRDPKTGLVELKNRPSDGHDFFLPLSVERPVANVLGVRVTGEEK
jgi:hypothetical protein